MRREERRERDQTRKEEKRGKENAWFASYRGKMGDGLGVERITTGKS